MADWVEDIYEAILLRSIKDLKNSVDYSRPGYARHIGPEVRAWFGSDLGFEDGELFSFACCCSVLKTCHHKVRRWLAPWLTPKNAHLACGIPVDNPVDKHCFIISRPYWIRPKAYRIHIGHKSQYGFYIYREAS